MPCKSNALFLIVVKINILIKIITIDHLILVISLGIAIILVTVAISVVIHITIIAVRSRVKGRSSQHPNSTTSSTNRVPTEPPVIYEDLEQVNKDIDLENNMAYSSAHV